MMPKPKPAKAGNTLFVQSCARMMGAAWIRRQIEETSTAPLNGISGIAYSIRLTVASDISMAFELGLKSVEQGLSPHPDGQPQVVNSHALSAVVWQSLPDGVQQEVNDEAEAAVCREHGTGLKGKVLPFGSYLKKHSDFLDRTVSNRYALVGETQWKSDHRFIAPGGFHGPALETYDGKACVDGLAVLLAYWRAIMKTACGLRWEDARCEADDGLAADRDEAWALVDRAIEQMLGNISVMIREELLEKRWKQRKPPR